MFVFTSFNVKNGNWRYEIDFYKDIDTSGIRNQGDAQMMNLNIF